MGPVGRKPSRVWFHGVIGVNSFGRVTWAVERPARESLSDEDD